MLYYATAPVLGISEFKELQAHNVQSEAVMLNQIPETHIARIDHSHSTEGWGIATTAGGKSVFLHVREEAKLLLVGSELAAHGVSLKEAVIPEQGVEIAFSDLGTPWNSGKFPMALQWMTLEYIQKMQAAAKKAAATLAERAVQIEAENRERQQRIAAAQRRDSANGSKKDKEEGKPSKQERRAMRKRSA